MQIFFVISCKRPKRADMVLLSLHEHSQISNLDLVRCLRHQPWREMGISAPGFMTLSESLRWIS